MNSQNECKCERTEEIYSPFGNGQMLVLVICKECKRVVSQRVEDED